MAACIVNIFPIVRRHDKAAFGHYCTKAMVLAYYNALAAGDTGVDVVAQPIKPVERKYELGLRNWITSNSVKLGNAQAHAETAMLPRLRDK